MACEFSGGPKIYPKRSFCGEIKHTFKVRPTELYFEAIESNGDPENSQMLSLNVAYFRDKLYLLPNLFFQSAISFWFSIQPEPHAVIDCLFFSVSHAVRCSEVNSAWLVSFELANLRAPKALFTCVICNGNRTERSTILG